jgi:hypothetical protein
VGIGELDEQYFRGSSSWSAMVSTKGLENKKGEDNDPTILRKKNREDSVLPVQKRKTL